MRVLAWLSTVLFAALALLSTGWCISSFAAYGSGLPLWFRTLAGVEGTVSQLLGVADFPVFTRSVVLAVLASLFWGLAAYCKPRSPKGKGPGKSSPQGQASGKPTAPRAVSTVPNGPKTIDISFE